MKKKTDENVLEPDRCHVAHYLPNWWCAAADVTALVLPVGGFISWGPETHETTIPGLTAALPIHGQ